MDRTPKGQKFELNILIGVISIRLFSFHANAVFSFHASVDQGIYPDLPPYPDWSLLDQVYKEQDHAWSTCDDILYFTYLMM